MVRKADREDLNFIYGLYMHSEVNPYLLYEIMEEEKFIPIFKDLLAKDVVYVFIYDNEPAGMFKLIPLTERNSHIAYLGGLAIDPIHGGKGLGQILMKEILSMAREKNFLRIELSVATSNQRAIRLYEKSGFEKREY